VPFCSGMSVAVIGYEGGAVFKILNTS
jgi:hypothetical protein